MAFRNFSAPKLIRNFAIIEPAKRRLYMALLQRNEAMVKLLVAGGAQPRCSEPLGNHFA